MTYLITVFKAAYFLWINSSLWLLWYWIILVVFAGRREISIESLWKPKSRLSIGDGDDMRQKLRDRLRKHYKDFLSSEPEEVLEIIIDDNLPNVYDADINTHWPVIASSKIFEESVDRVQDIAIPTFFSEAKRLISGGRVGEQDHAAAASTTSLLRALAEIQWCFMQTGVAPIIHVSIPGRSRKNFRISNFVKLAVEAKSRSEWQWWPLQPPTSRRKAGDTECRISWKCVSFLLQHRFCV